MSAEKPKGSGKAGSRKRRKCKRSASSPLTDNQDTVDIVVDSGETQYTIITGGGKGKRNINKSSKASENLEANAVSDQITFSASHGGTFNNMAYSQNAFNGFSQLMQSPSPSHPSGNVFPAQNPQFQQFGQASQYNQPASAPAPAPTPVWANEMLEEMKQLKTKMSVIETKLNKIDKIEQTVNQINAKVSDLETNFKRIEKRVDENENSCKFISEMWETNKVELKQTNEELSKMKKTCATLETNTSKLVKENLSLEEKVIDLEVRSMRENLILYGQPENEKEDCTKAMKEVITTHLGMSSEETESIVFDRVHRIGPRKTRGGNPRPIVAKFHQYSDRERIRQLSFDHTDELKNANLGIGVQWPKKIRDKRRELRPEMLRLRGEGKDAKLIRDKLFVNGREYVASGESNENAMED